MATFTNTIEIDGEERQVERTTDAPAEITALRASGWKEKAEVPEDTPAKAPEPTRPALPTKAPAKTTDN